VGSQPIMLRSGVGKARAARCEFMKNKTVKKIQFGGWTKRRYKEIRRVVKTKIEKEEKIKLQ
jgi:hypothetical protein